MSFECHKLADDQIPENVLKPSAQQNEIAETYPFVWSLHEQVTALSSVSMEFNSVQGQDSPTMQLFDTRYFLFPLWASFDPWITSGISLSIWTHLILRLEETNAGIRRRNKRALLRTQNQLIVDGFFVSPDTSYIWAADANLNSTIGLHVEKDCVVWTF